MNIRERNKLPDKPQSGNMNNPRADDLYTEKPGWTGEPLLKETGDMRNQESGSVRLFGWNLNKVIIVTHVNIFLYSTCFWIQTGTLPVSITIY